MAGMRPIDHFFSGLARLESSLRPGTVLDAASAERLSRDFTSLVGPVIGAAPAEQFFFRARERLEKRGGSPADLGVLAAFFLGDFDDSSMSLGDEDWEDIRETLEEASEEMNLETLTALMGELLHRGKV
jgi:hypothetical protein